jgi:hypothetical protein
VAKSWPLRHASASGIHTCTLTHEYLPAVRRDVARVAPQLRTAPLLGNLKQPSADGQSSPAGLPLGCE